MYAVIQTGGKQYRVFEGDRIAVERLAADPGTTVDLDVLFLADGSDLSIGTEALEKAKVTAEVLEHFRGEKALVFKFKKRKGYKRLRGHRQELTRLEITAISATGIADRSRKADAEKAAVAAEDEAKAKAAVEAEEVRADAAKAQADEAEATAAATEAEATEAADTEAADTEAVDTGAAVAEAPEAEAPEAADDPEDKESRA